MGCKVNVIEGVADKLATVKIRTAEAGTHCPRRLGRLEMNRPGKETRAGDPPGTRCVDTHARMNEEQSARKETGCYEGID